MFVIDAETAQLCRAAIEYYEQVVGFPPSKSERLKLISNCLYLSEKWGTKE